MGSTLTVDNIVGATTAANVKLPAGTVLQTVNATHATATTSTSSSFVATLLNATITPKYNTSKILVRFSLPAYAASGIHVVGTIFRETGIASSNAAISGTNLGDSGWGFSSTFNNGAEGMGGVHCTGVLDSPATTSALRYTVAYRQHNNGTATVFPNGSMGTITLQEVSQ